MLALKNLDYGLLAFEIPPMMYNLIFSFDEIRKSFLDENPELSAASIFF